MNEMIVTKGNAHYLNSTRAILYTGGVTAILASTCCIGSFLYTAIGLSRPTSLYLVTLAEWGRIPLLVVSLITLVLAYKRIWHPVSTYETGEDCASPLIIQTNKVFFYIVALLVIGMFMLPYFVQVIV